MSYVINPLVDLKSIYSDDCYELYSTVNRWFKILDTEWATAVSEDETKQEVLITRFGLVPNFINVQCVIHEPNHNEWTFVIEVQSPQHMTLTITQETKDPVKVLRDFLKNRLGTFIRENLRHVVRFVEMNADVDFFKA